MRLQSTTLTRLTMFVVTSNVTLGLGACSQGESDPDMVVDGSTDSSSSAASSTATSTANSSTASAATSTMPATTSSAPASTTSAETSTSASASDSSGASTTSLSTSSNDGSDTSDNSTVNDGTSSQSSNESSGASDATTSGLADEDFVPLPEHFTCIKEWTNGPGFRITNVLGRLDEALAVANSDTGGEYPVGTILQHLPTEAMVKRHKGYSPDTKDWEFYLLTLSAEGATFMANGPDITTMGNTCKSCHQLADEQWDFVCNTSKDHGGAACHPTLEFSQMQRDNAADPRCD